MSYINEFFEFFCYAEAGSNDGQLPARIRSPLDGVNKAMQVNSGIERRKAALPGPDRLGKQGVHLPDVKRITTGEI